MKALPLSLAVVAWAVQAIVPGARTPFRPQRRRAVAWNGPLVAAAFLAFIILPGFLLPYLHPPALALVKRSPVTA